MNLVDRLTQTSQSRSVWSKPINLAERLTQTSQNRSVWSKPFKLVHFRLLSPSWCPHFHPDLNTIIADVNDKNQVKKQEAPDTVSIRQITASKIKFEFHPFIEPVLSYKITSQ